METLDVSPAQAMRCPLCGDPAPKPPLARWKGWAWRDCAACGIAFADPFKNPGPGFYERFEDLYPHEAQDSTDPMTSEYDEALASFTGSEVRGLKLLDVGCGGGGFLARARRLGFDAAGVDFNAKRLSLVRERLGLKTLYAGSLEGFEREHPSERFDVVTLFQVLEHLDAPARWLTSARALLKPGGRLFIGVPNRDRAFDPFTGPGMEELDNPPNHLTRWRAASLTRFIEGCGFEVESVRALPVPRALFGLMVRNTLRLGLATRALGVDELQHARAGAGAPRAGRVRLVRGLVAVKEAVLEGAATALYPGFCLAGAVLGWEGAVLLAQARRGR